MVRGDGKEHLEPGPKRPRHDSLFGHMLVEEAAASAAMARRRAMMLVDVLVERHGSGRLRRRWVFASALLAVGYLRYALPVYASWGARHLERSMDASAFAEIVGGPHSQVSFGVLVVTTLLYLTLLHCSRRVMEARTPVSGLVFETLVVYNMTQTLLNSYVCVRILAEARSQGFRYPWGNQFSYTKEGHRLGYYIWFHYHCCQLELLDTLFVVIRKKFRQITFLHVWLRLLNLWGWFFACRYACGGDAYFPAATNAATRAVVYAFYSLSLLTERGVPFLRKARVTGVQMLQLVVCLLHALYCLFAFWDMQIPRSVLVLYALVMLNGLVLYTDFHFQAEGKSKAYSEPRAKKISFSFDSSGWLYCYHFGVAKWLREHLLPEGIGLDDCDSTKYPADLIFSGSSGGALAAAALSLGHDPAEIFEIILTKQPECRCNPFRMLPAVEDILRKTLPSNAWKSLTGRIRVVLTRVSWRYPFFTAEVVNQFRNNEDVFHTLRATCHVPFVAGLGPYCYDGNAYLDGLMWPQLLVPWKGTLDAFKVRVSACSMPLSDIKPPMLPMWWVVFPPSVETLRGMFWMGYRDAARWFTQSPNSTFECFSCKSPPRGALEAEPSDSGGRRRRPRLAGPSNGAEAATDEPVPEDRSATWLAAKKMVVRPPCSSLLPEVDEVTRRPPSELIRACEVALDRERRRVVMVVVPLLLTLVAWLLQG